MRHFLSIPVIVQSHQAPGDARLINLRAPVFESFRAPGYRITSLTTRRSTPDVSFPVPGSSVVWGASTTQGFSIVWGTSGLCGVGSPTSLNRRDAEAQRIDD